MFVHMVKAEGATINRRSGLVVVHCIKIDGNEQLTITLFNKEFGGRGVTKNFVKFKGRVTFLNILRRGRARIFCIAVDGDSSGPPPPPLSS